MTSLFEPTKLGNITVKNRIFMAPLTRNRAAPDGVPSDMTATYYAQRASGGLIISEATQISEMGKGYINTPGIYNDAQKDAWKNITRAVHEKDGKIFLQLWHVGRISHTSLLPAGQSPVAPSAIQAQSETVTENGRTPVSAPRALQSSEIKNTIEDYRKAAKLAKDAGFDGVEIHAANGYLIDQFLQDKTNTREDEYGGSTENRIRFLHEVVGAITSIWNSKSVGVRLSPVSSFNDMGDSNPAETFGAAIDMLNGYNLAYLHIVERFAGAGDSSEDQAIISALRAKWNGFYVANGDYDLARSKQAITSGHADAITYGKPYIANPDLPERLQAGADLNQADESTFYGGGAEGYTDYPFMDNKKAA